MYKLRTVAAGSLALYVEVQRKIPSHVTVTTNHIESKKNAPVNTICDRF